MNGFNDFFFPVAIYSLMIYLHLFSFGKLLLPNIVILLRLYYEVACTIDYELRLLVSFINLL